MILKAKDKQAKGAHGFLSLDEYIRDLKLKGYKVAWLRTLNLGQTPAEQVHTVMAATAADNRKVKRPALHLVYAFPPSERPDQPTCVAIVEQSLEWLRLGDHQAMIIADDERKHFHLHVMVNIVHPHTKRASKFRETHKLRLVVAVAAHIEKQFGLERVPRRGWTEADIIAELTGAKIKPLAADETAAQRPTDRVREAQLHRDVLDIADLIRQQLDRKPASFKTWDELHQYFLARKIHYRASGNGAAMGMDGHETRAFEVERGWSLARLKKQLSGEPPIPLRLGILPPPKIKVSPAISKTELTDAPVIELATNLKADSLVFHRVEADGDTRRLAVPTDKLPGKLPGLMRAAANGANILAAPVAADRHFLPVQEMSAAQLTALEKDHTAAAVIARGDTFDAFIAVKKLSTQPDAESAAARQLTEDLQQQYAPGSPALPAIGVLPAPGFSFRARKRGAATAAPTLVALLRPVATFCRQATAKFQKLAKDWEAKLHMAFKGSLSNSALIGLQRFNLRGSPPTAAAMIYQAHLMDLAKYSPVKGFSQDAMDRLLAQRLRDGHSSKAEIAEVLEAGLLHINPDTPEAAAKANTIAAWIISPAALESHPPITGMAEVWAAITETAKTQFIEMDKAADQARTR